MRVLRAFWEGRQSADRRLATACDNAHLDKKKPAPDIANGRQRGAGVAVSEGCFAHKPTRENDRVATARNLRESRNERLWNVIAPRVKLANKGDRRKLWGKEIGLIIRALAILANVGLILFAISVFDLHTLTRSLEDAFGFFRNICKAHSRVLHYVENFTIFAEHLHGKPIKLPFLIAYRQQKPSSHDGIKYV